ncbi:MAG: CPBP family intramembrane metalloprotease [Nitrospirae bacterium]|nr:CPBP family intramembrane metalloprotease [Nitrospirota bacterium]
MVMIRAMARWRIVGEGVVVFSTAIATVYLFRAGIILSVEDASWLIPLTWIVAAVLATWPLFATSRDLFTWRQWFGSPRETARWLVTVSLIVLPVFGFVYLPYWGWWHGAAIEPSLPPRWGAMVSYQLLYVGFPEELFFRGYLQQRFDDAFGRPYRLWGASWGLGLLLANLLFAAGHLLVTGDVARLNVFLPGLLFGWLLARTGALIAPMLFHGLCNISLFTLQAWVGP